MFYDDNFILSSQIVNPICNKDMASATCWPMSVKEVGDWDMSDREHITDCIRCKPIPANSYFKGVITDESQTKY